MGSTDVGTGGSAYRRRTSPQAQGSVLVFSTIIAGVDGHAGGRDATALAATLATGSGARSPTDPRVPYPAGGDARDCDIEPPTHPRGEDRT